MLCIVPFLLLAFASVFFPSRRVSIKQKAAIQDLEAAIERSNLPGAQQIFDSLKVQNKSSRVKELLVLLIKKQRDAGLRAPARENSLSLIELVERTAFG